MKNILIVVTLILSGMLSAQDIKLPAPQTTGGMPLMEALNQRQSKRDYAAQDLSKQQLSNLLWAAYGYNRGQQEKHTAPSSMNYQEIEIYVTLSSGLYFYDVKNHVLVQKNKKDLRSATGKQDFVKDAPLNIVYVANYANNEKINEDNWLHYSYANVGFISQNIYLYCASEGLGTVVRGWFDKDALESALQLPQDNVVILTQSVGVVK